MADDKWVYVTHPKVTGDPVRVTRDAFENKWKGLGWKLASKTAVEAASKEG